MNDPYGAGDPSENLAGPLLRQIGTHLRLAREERGEDLRTVATILRIRRTYLENLEDGELAQIPGRAYALGFLRTYAEHLGFDGEAIVEEVKRANAQLPESPQLHIREPLPESQRPPLVLVGASVLLAAVVYVGWSYWQNNQTPEVLAELVAPESQPTPGDTSATAGEAAPIEALVEPETSQAETDPTLTEPSLPPLPPIPGPPRTVGTDFADDAFNEPAAEASLAESEAAIDAILDGVPAEEPVDATIATDGEDLVEVEDTPETQDEVDFLALIQTASGGAEARPFGDAEEPGRVVLVASEASWVQIRSEDREFVWTRTMEPGDAFFVPDRDDLALWTGNAGGLKVIIDGAEPATLGDRGEVRRDIPLAVDALQAQYAEN